MSVESIAKIDGSSIVNVVIEAETTFSQKVTIARMDMVVFFAFAVPKRKKEELAYLTIKCSDGRFEHDTVLEYEGKGSLAKANVYKNKLLSWIK